MENIIFIVIAAYNEAQVIQEVISEIKEHGYNNIVVVDDGSSDLTYERAKIEGVTVLRHKINRGKGAAVKTGIVASNLLGAGIIVTIDGDGQHDPGDIEALTEPIRHKNYDVVLGSRRKKQGEMPVMKIIANRIGNLITLLFYGLYVTDSQSGFRAYSHFAAKVIDTKADKYEYDSKVIREIKRNNLLFKEVPIKVRYTDYSKGKPQKQGFVNGIKTLARMLWDIFA